MPPLVAALATDHLPVTPLLDAKDTEPRGPEHSRGNHAACGNPAYNEEVLSSRGMHVGLLGDLVQFRDTLGANHGDDDGSHSESECTETSEDEIDQDEKARRGKDKGGDAANNSEAAETHADDVDDEDGKKEIVDEIDLLLDLRRPIDVGEVDAQIANRKLLVKHLGKVERV